MVNKWDRRDKKRNKTRKMRVDGASTKLLWSIVVEKSERARSK